MQEDIQMHCDVDVAEFAPITIPKNTIDDVLIFPMVARIPDLMLNLVNPSIKLLTAYRATMDSNPTSILPPRVTSHGVEGSSKVTKPKKKESVVKLKPVEEVVKQTVPASTGKWVLKRMNKNTTKK